MKGTVQIISGRLQGVRTVLHPRTIEVTPLEMRGRYLAVIVANMLILRNFVRNDSIEVARVLGRTNSKWLAVIRKTGAPPLAETFVADAKMRIATIHPSLGFELHLSQSFLAQSLVSAVTALREADRDFTPKNLARIGFAAIGLEAEPLAFKRMAVGLVAEIDQHKLLGNTIRYLSEVIGGDRVSILEKATHALENELLGLPAAVPSWVEIPLPELSVSIADFGLLRMDATGFSSAAQSSLALGFTEHASFTLQAETFFFSTVKAIAAAYGEDIYILNSTVDDIVAIGRLESLRHFSQEVSRAFSKQFEGSLRAGTTRINGSSPLSQITRDVHTAMHNNAV